MTKGIKKNSIRRIIKIELDASSSGTNIFDLNETSIQNKS